MRTTPITIVWGGQSYTKPCGTIFDWLARTVIAQPGLRTYSFPVVLGDGQQIEYTAQRLLEKLSLFLNEPIPTAENPFPDGSVIDTEA